MLHHSGLTDWDISSFAREFLSIRSILASKVAYTRGLVLPLRHTIWSPGKDLEGLLSSLL